jgi:hypothetical protein
MSGDPSAVLTLVYRRDCLLCDEMLAALRALERTQPLPPLQLRDVDEDPQLQRRYGLQVPVLLFQGALVCRYRLDVPELRRLLRQV